MSGIAVRGDSAELAALVDKLDWLSGEAPRKEINRLCGEAALTQLRRQFASSHDPYGSAWEPLKHRKGKPLLDTGRLRNSFSATDVTGSGFTVGTNVEYAGPHQDGAIVNRGARTNAHAKSGKFISRAAASKRKSAVRISFTAAGQIVIPQRMMVPEGSWGQWGPIFDKEAEDYLEEQVAAR